MVDGDEHASVVGVVYAEPDEQIIVQVAYEPGLTARAAVERSGLLQRFPSIREHPLVLGVFGTEVPATYALRAGDRVEICRPLRRNPQDMRRELSRQGKVIGSAPRDSGENG